MSASYLIWVVLLLCGAAQAFAQPAPADPAAQRVFTVFFRGAPIGREELTTRIDGGTATLTAQSRIGAPLNIVLRNVEVKYQSDWTPESLALDATVNKAEVTLKTTFANGVATSEGVDGGLARSAANPIAPNTLVVPSVFFAGYDAIGRRLARGTTGDFHIFIAPGLDITFRVRSASDGRMQVGTSTFSVRQYELLLTGPNGDMAVNLAADADGGLLRLSVPAQALEVVREDLATPTARTQIHSNPTDEAVIIPAVSFSIGATLTRPPASSSPSAKLPAVVLLTGSGANDRDGYASGIPIVGQLAGALADAGFLAIRYDKRGYGQSGGRSESATLSDYAEDARTVVRWLAQRKDVDSRRIVLLGHSEGAWVALLAASREKRVAGVIAIAAPSSSGAELVLEQQTRALDQLNLSPAERDRRIELQKKIQAAVLSGTGWEGVPADMKRQADTSWFQSFLAFKPEDVLEKVRQPLLLVHGQLDRQVVVSHIDRLSDLAKAGKSVSVEAVTVRGVNHLLVPATTGEVAEYATLPDRNVSRDVTMAVTDWLMKTLAAQGAK